MTKAKSGTVDVLLRPEFNCKIEYVHWQTFSHGFVNKSRVTHSVALKMPAVVNTTKVAKGAELILQLPECELQKKKKNPH